MVDSNRRFLNTSLDHYLYVILFGPEIPSGNNGANVWWVSEPYCKQSFRWRFVRSVSELSNAEKCEKEL
jgi:hypothetical protein